ncbi:endonuclease (plasmid) [Cryobacterium sp. LW097]|uniref:endonuclease n=1 Tax=unclassified Cryobacterium TaxID=2649013 RepID=UPI000B4D411B|nr:MULTISPECIES: endonuclease [unclassified Cryobacterium]ASD24182.1 endonuclease [Cryobacterium sp. LW097]TFC56831.1 endonuclease [Cryobacterium sp. TMB1-7]TFC57920.1 endonuclease [Cryobacterium sp. TMB3-1-2]TFC70081.1 endonuclease [Cryobacterium sp. TMB3-15]TFC75451.1 endonuclease [Cryobacterium sp. TMB3-10]
MAAKEPPRYEQILNWVFKHHYLKGDVRVEWDREDLDVGAEALGLKRVKNLGDIPYTYRFRKDMPSAINATALKGMEWIIRGSGDGKYRFDAIPAQIPITPNPSLSVTKIPDATPEIIAAAALSDEQALLAKVRYNRLIDIFLGVASYSLQNHLRTNVADIGQVEVDEIYAAVDRYGRQFILPVQAKGGSDRLGITQVEQDMAACAVKWPEMICRNISVQFAGDGLIALFDLTVQDDRVVIRREAHYKLVSASDITAVDLRIYDLAAGYEDV